MSIRIAVLVSGGGSNLQSIIDACESGKIEGEVVTVGSDNYEAYGLERAKKADIPTIVVDYKSIINNCTKYPSLIEKYLPEDFKLNEMVTKQNIFKTDSVQYSYADTSNFLMIRAIAEKSLLKMLGVEFDLLVLAGFMRIFSPYIIDRINTNGKHRIMNIHPALLPAFPGVDGYGDTFRYGCKIGGCTVHFVDYGEDTGPIIGQKSFEITNTDTLDTVKKKGLELEWKLYPECIQLFAQDKLKVIDRRVVKVLPV